MTRPATIPLPRRSPRPGWPGLVVASLLPFVRPLAAQSPSAAATTVFNPAPSEAPVAPGKLLLQDRRDQVTLRRETGVTQPIDPPQELRSKERLTTSSLGYALILGGRQALVLDQATSVEVARRALPGLRILQGQLYAKSLGPPTTEGLWVQWGDNHTVELTGTEFHFRLDPATGRPELNLLEGEPRTVPPDLIVRRVGPDDLDGFKDLIQWALYYPPVLDLDELDRELAWESARIPELQPSLDRYRAGDLPNAFALYPPTRLPGSDAEKLYHAALCLAAGRPEVTASVVASLVPSPAPASPSPAQRFALALGRTLRAVKLQIDPNALEPRLASEWLAESYYQQSLLTRPELTPSAQERVRYGTVSGRLEKARDAARRATEAHAAFGFAQERLAELLFSFGELESALPAIDAALRLTPANAPAYALRGFLRGGRGESEAALADFREAIRLDSKLGSAWLGQGLIRFGQGKSAEGLTSLQMAVMREPQRALFRSYLGKGYHEAVTSSAHPLDSLRDLFSQDTNRPAQIRRAAEELAVARKLDPQDPTPDLYAALLARSDNRINEAVRGLERSAELNDNRALYRSRFLLDEDRAVRGAALAQVYRDAGMTDLAVREAGRAVASEYGNPSAHLFLASGYDQLRDPRQINLRYDNPWQTELLLANLLRPVGAGSLSQTVSQQEFTRLFDREHTGLYSATDYASQGDWRESASIYGWYDRVAFAFDTFYQSRTGDRPNEASESRTLAATAKFQVTPDDELYFEVRHYDFTSGDLTPYEDPARARVALAVAEQQEPLALAGYHHRWNPGNHTLFLFARLTDDLQVRDPGADTTLAFLNAQGQVRALDDFAADLDYEGRLTIYSLELQQIWRLPDSPFGGITGVRYQLGDFPTTDHRAHPTGLPRLPPVPFVDPIQNTSVAPGFDRFSFYSYQNYEAIEDRLWLTAGLTVDDLKHPRNHRFSPISAGEDRAEMVAPKAGAILRLDPRTTLQGVYSRWLGGVSFDQSFGLEPAQIAGFSQNYRDVFPASLTGSPAAPRNQLYGLLLDHRFTTDTYVGLQAQVLEADVDQDLGVFLRPAALREPLRVGRVRQTVDYRERALQFTVDQLLQEQWSINLRYRLTESDLTRQILDVADLGQETSALLHELRLFGRWNHPSGLFAVAGGTWRHQEVEGAARADFWQLDAEVGYRMLQRRLEFRAGILNLTDTDYRLSPLTPFAEPPRARTFVASLKFNF